MAMRDVPSPEAARPWASEEVGYVQPLALMTDDGQLAPAVPLHGSAERLVVAAPSWAVSPFVSGAQEAPAGGVPIREVPLEGTAEVINAVILVFDVASLAAGRLCASDVELPPWTEEGSPSLRTLWALGVELGYLAVDLSGDPEDAGFVSAVSCDFEARPAAGDGALVLDSGGRGRGAAGAARSRGGGATRSQPKLTLTALASRVDGMESTLRDIAAAVGAGAGRGAGAGPPPQDGHAPFIPGAFTPIDGGSPPAVGRGSPLGGVRPGTPPGLGPPQRDPQLSGPGASQARLVVGGPPPRLGGAPGLGLASDRVRDAARAAEVRWPAAPGPADVDAEGEEDLGAAWGELAGGGWPPTRGLPQQQQEQQQQQQFQ